jgi:hypothetical protein
MQAFISLMGLSHRAQNSFKIDDPLHLFFLCAIANAVTLELPGSRDSGLLIQQETDDAKVLGSKVATSLNG